MRNIIAVYSVCGFYGALAKSGLADVRIGICYVMVRAGVRNSIRGG